jgi:CHRD domain-containing protein
VRYFLCGARLGEAGGGLSKKEDRLFTRLVIVAALGAALAASYAAASTGSASSTPTFHSVVVAKLTGRTEVPKGSGTGSGTARITLNLKTGKACWKLSVKSLDKTLSAHVHKAARGKTGPVVIPLGARFLTVGCVSLPKKSLTAVGRNPGAYYVNVHTKRYPNGAIRGQLRAG